MRTVSVTRIVVILFNGSRNLIKAKLFDHLLRRQRESTEHRVDTLLVVLRDPILAYGHRVHVDNMLFRRKGKHTRRTEHPQLAIALLQRLVHVGLKKHDLHRFRRIREPALNVRALVKAAVPRRQSEPRARRRGHAGKHAGCKNPDRIRRRSVVNEVVHVLPVLSIRRLKAPRCGKDVVHKVLIYGLEGVALLFERPKARTEFFNVRRHAPSLSAKHTAAAKVSRLVRAAGEPRRAAGGVALEQAANVRLLLVGTVKVLLLLESRFLRRLSLTATLRIRTVSRAFLLICVSCRARRGHRRPNPEGRCCT